MSTVAEGRKAITSIAPMPGAVRNLVLGALAATAIAGCGSDDETIPRTDAEALLARLDAVEENVSQGACNEATAQVEAFRSDVSNLSGVDREVKRALAKSAVQLLNLAAGECEEDSGIDETDETTTTTTEPEVETTTTTTTEETTTEETTPDENDGAVSPPPETGDTTQGGNQGGSNAGQGGGVGPSGGVGEDGN